LIAGEGSVRERGIKGESLNGESLKGVSFDDETTKTE